MIVVFFEMLRAVFSARCLTMKLPKPRRYTFSFFSNKLSLMVSIKDSTTAETSFLAMPVDVAISLMISAFVILFLFFIDVYFYSLVITECKDTHFQLNREIFLCRQPLFRQGKPSASVHLTSHAALNPTTFQFLQIPLFPSLYSS